jgi:hypothetical protein
MSRSLEARLSPDAARFATRPERESNPDRSVERRAPGQRGERHEIPFELKMRGAARR